MLAVDLKRSQGRRREQLDPLGIGCSVRLEPLPERQPGDPILDDMAKVWLPQIGRVEMDLGAADRVPDLHLAVGADAKLNHSWPGTEALQQPLTGATQRRDAQIDLTGRPNALRWLAIDEGDAQATLGAGTGQCGANHAAADDGDVHLSQEMFICLGHCSGPQWSGPWLRFSLLRSSSRACVASNG